ncbi:MAG TPA: response regulator [Acidimicrobiales bacterium]|nr:response regulator [Acidimicrobiales bacterium]
MPDVLIAADAPWVREEVRSVLSGLPDVSIREVDSGAAVVAAVEDAEPDLLILDFQIGNMGAIAVTLELRLEESADRLDHVPVLVLVDRRPDVFLARRSDAEGWLVKPLDPIRLRKAATALLEGGTYYDDSYQPQPVVARAAEG